MSFPFCVDFLSWRCLSHERNILDTSKAKGKQTQPIYPISWYDYHDCITFSILILGTVSKSFLVPISKGGNQNEAASFLLLCALRFHLCLLHGYLRKRAQEVNRQTRTSSGWSFDHGSRLYHHHVGRSNCFRRSVDSFAIKKVPVFHVKHWDFLFIQLDFFQVFPLYEDNFQVWL